VLDLNLAKKDLPESLWTLSALVADLNPEFLNTGCPNSSIRKSSTVIEVVAEFESVANLED
jgi:hypothetical protein